VDTVQRDGLRLHAQRRKALAKSWGYTLRRPRCQFDGSTTYKNKLERAAGLTLPISFNSLIRAARLCARNSSSLRLMGWASLLRPPAPNTHRIVVPRAAPEVSRKILS
jgi:hypothetical protein